MMAPVPTRLTASERSVATVIASDVDGVGGVKVSSSRRLLALRDDALPGSFVDCDCVEGFALKSFEVAR